MKVPDAWILAGCVGWVRLVLGTGERFQRGCCTQEKLVVAMVHAWKSEKKRSMTVTLATSRTSSGHFSRSAKAGGLDEVRGYLLGIVVPRRF